MGETNDRWFDELFYRFHERLVGVLIRYGRIPEDARELALQAFQQVHPKVHGMSDESFWRYVRAAALRLAINHARDEKALKRGRPKPLEETHDAEDDRISPETQLLRDEAQARFTRQFHDAVEALGAETRETFKFHLQGRSHREIATLQNIDEVTVRSRISRAIKYLRTRIDYPTAGIQWLQLPGEHDHEHEE